jgi:hypothetical protein
LPNYNALAESISTPDIFPSAENPYLAIACCTASLEAAYPAIRNVASNGKDPASLPRLYKLYAAYNFAAGLESAASSNLAITSLFGLAPVISSTIYAADSAYYFIVSASTIFLLPAFKLLCIKSA